jgi:hypothetical protein
MLFFQRSPIFQKFNFCLLLPAFILLSVDGFASCRSGYSEGSLEKAKQSVLVGGIAEIRDGELEYRLSLEYQRQGSSLGFTLSISLPGKAGELQKLVALEQSLKDRTIAVVCVRPDSTSYYRNMVLPARLVIEHGALPILYELDPMKPVSN